MRPATEQSASAKDKILSILTNLIIQDTRVCLQTGRSLHEMENLGNAILGPKRGALSERFTNQPSADIELPSSP